MRVSSREKKTDENSMHTSVVIKLPDEEKPDDINMYKIDLEDVETSKGYVIDRLFSNDEIAVYAMFEASAFDNEKSLKNLKKLSCSNFGDFRFSQTRTYSERKYEKGQLSEAQIMNTKEEHAAFLEFGTDNLNCRRNCAVSDREDNSWGVGKTTKDVKLKLISKGVNTDIDQSPRLLEEVRKAISLNFSKTSEKTVESSSFFSEKSSQDLREVITRVNSTTFSLDGKNGKYGEKSFPNIVMVPVIIKNDDLYNFLKDRNSQESPSFSQSLGSKTSVLLEKVSVSTSTELSFFQHKNNEEPEMLQNKRLNFGKADEGKENGKSQEYLLEAVKNLQEKFNTLLKSLESIAFAEKKETRDITTEPEDSKPVCKSLNKFDEIPIFSPEICVFSEPKNWKEKAIDIEIKEEVPPIVLNSESFTKDLIRTKEVADKCVIIWKEQQNYKEGQQSKSQTNIRCAELKNTNLKKSLSMELVRESCGSKKLENTLLKLESRAKKKNKTIRLNEELGLMNKLNESKLHESPKFESVEMKSTTNDLNIKTAANGLLKIHKSQLNKDSEKWITEKLLPSRILTKTNNADPGDMKDTKLAKKAGLRSRTTETVKFETKIACHQEKKQNPKSAIRRVPIKDSSQSKLHVNLLIKSQQNCEQKKNSPVKSNSTRLPRANFQKRDDALPKKEKKAELDLFTASKISVGKNLKAESPECVKPTTASMVVLELFSKKPSSMEDFNSEVDLQCQYNSDVNGKENFVSGKNDISNDCQNPVVKSVWALKKVFLYEDGKKKMEVLEASSNPPDYCFNQNSTEDKIR